MSDKPERKLSVKQKMFCREYLKDLNATQAAVRAGYSEKSANRIGAENLTKPYLSEYIQEIMNKRAEKVEISAEEVLNDILATRNTCKELMLTEDEYGNPVLDKDALNGRNKTNELLGKHLKLFTDKVEVTVKEMPTIKLGK